MNLIFNYFPGKLKRLVILGIMLPQIVLGINIRGNGGFSIKYSDGKIYPSDLFLRFNGWAPRTLKCGTKAKDWHDLVGDLIETSEIFARDKEAMLASLYVIQNGIRYCAFEDFNRPNVEYTFLAKEFDIFLKPRIFNDELIAINFTDLSQSKIIDFCVNYQWASPDLSEESRAILILHELIYVTAGAHITATPYKLALVVNDILDTYEQKMCPAE